MQLLAVLRMSEGARSTYARARLLARSRASRAPSPGGQLLALRLPMLLLHPLLLPLHCCCCLPQRVCTHAMQGCTRTRALRSAPT